jgi:hypothetical protein
MSRYQTEIHGHVVEAREDGLGNRELLVDGRVMHRAWLGAWLGRSLTYEVRDERGANRAVEVRWVSRPGSLGMRQQVRVLVDGIDRVVLDPLPERQPPGRCPNCGYELRGLGAENGEVKCPECGRHASAKLLGQAPTI